MSAANTRSESEKAVSMTTRTSGCFSRSAWVSSMPPSPGISTSISTRCGRGRLDGDGHGAASRRDPRGQRRDPDGECAEGRMTGADAALPYLAFFVERDGEADFDRRTLARREELLAALARDPVRSSAR